MSETLSEKFLSIFFKEINVPKGYSVIDLFFVVYIIFKIKCAVEDSYGTNINAKITRTSKISSSFPENHKEEIKVSFGYPFRAVSLRLACPVVD